MGNQRGATLVDTLVALALLGLAVAVVVPNLATTRRRVGLDHLARAVAGHAQLCRLRAINAQRNVGLVFSCPGGRWEFAAAMDGDGDGVSRRDVLAGVDPTLGPAVQLDRLCPGARVGVPEGWSVPNPSGRGRLRLADGLAAGSSDIISFSPLGDATPATVYITDDCERLLAVRVYGGTARVRVLEWRQGWSRWRRLAL